MNITKSVFVIHAINRLDFLHHYRMSIRTSNYKNGGIFLPRQDSWYGGTKKQNKPIKKTGMRPHYQERCFLCSCWLTFNLNAMETCTKDYSPPEHYQWRHHGPNQKGQEKVQYLVIMH